MDKDLLRYKGMKTILSTLIGLSILQGVSIILQAIWLAEVVTHLFNKGPIHMVYSEMLYFLLTFLMRHAIHHLKQKIVFKYADTIGADLRNKALDNLFQLGPRVSKKLGTGNVVTLLLEGVTQFKQYIMIFLPKMSSMAVVPALIVIYILLQDRTSAIILIVTLPILIMFMILLGLAAQKKADKQWSMYRVLSNHYVDSLRGLETLKYLGRSRAHTDKIKDVSERYRKTTMGTLKMAFLSSFAMDFFTMLSVATVAVFLGLRLVEGEMTLQVALAILILAPEYFLPIREIGSDYHATLNGMEAGKKLLNIVSMPKFQYKQGKPLKVWNQSSYLRISSVAVQHDEESAPSLTNVNVTLNGFKKVGIVGESGAGKSTLVDVIGGFVEASSGQIGIDGQSFNHLQREDWQKQLNYIPQHPYLFHETIRHNIAFYKPDASEEEVRWAAQQAGLTKVIEELPHGLDEKIGEGGRMLSGGQAQRVAIARAFLDNRPILLLDEPTAHLDIETEYDLKQTMLSLFEEKLVFLATHRLHWMENMDYIYFLKHGEVAEEGTHEQLIQKKGYYYEMVQTQMGDMS
ncbi:thiol reductant ABC exporter subunit CydD [Bacillus sp. HMF5848]|uniref:thiol reductant ABC exporter subunit CydD n=1 Tax=Bacillus sp. HMF5848 TaxID=2495421 RepID=UPI000F76EB4F|nr:thiol reductant ABC exporter subunit CydD [Bacillus sp. HMF5848]RSK29119.1 thiol reductant ABC exporter subunit CydD [Bacillus sp. HMF5848]